MSINSLLADLYSRKWEALSERYNTNRLEITDIYERLIN